MAGSPGREYVRSLQSVPEKLPAEAPAAITALQGSATHGDLAVDVATEASDSPVALWSAFGKKSGLVSTLAEQPVQPPSTLSSADPRVDRPAHERTTSNASAAAALAAASAVHDPGLATAGGGGGWSIPASYGTAALPDSSSAGNSPAGGGDAVVAGSWNQGFPGFPVGMPTGQQLPPPPRARHFRSISTPSTLTLGDMTWVGVAASPPRSPAGASPSGPGLQAPVSALQRPSRLLLHHLSADSGLLLELVGSGHVHSRLPTSSTTTFHSRGSSANTHSRAASAVGLPPSVYATPPRHNVRVTAVEVQQAGVPLGAPWSSGSSSGGLGSDATAVASVAAETSVVHSRGDSQQTVESLDGPGMDALRASSGGLDAQLAALGLGDETGNIDREPSALERLYLSSGGFSSAAAAAIGDAQAAGAIASPVGGSSAAVSPQRSPTQAAAAAASPGMTSTPVPTSLALPPRKRALPPGHARSVSVPNIDLGNAVLGEGGELGAAELASQEWPDLTTEPSRHMWVGNLTTKLHRSALKALFEAHAELEDVVTFPGRMYAFVNFRSVDDAIRAHAALDGQEVHELTCGRKLVLKFRPSKKAIGRVRGDSAHAALAADYSETELLLPSDAAASKLHPDSATASDAGDGSRAASGAAAASGKAGGEWEGSSTPSPRVWLGNLTAGVTSKTLRTVFSPYGAVADAAVFPGRIGPLGYAFLNFEEVEAAIAAYDALNNTIVPLLTGNKQLKMRYKPVKDYEEGKSAAATAASAAAGTGAAVTEGDAGEGADAASEPAHLENAPSSAAQGARSRHLWLGNLVAKPGKPAIEEAFAKFGKLAGARVFPGKTYAFVNFEDVEAAEAALQSMDGAVVQSLTAGKTLVVRYQLDPDARDKKRSTSGEACALAPGEDAGVTAAVAAAAAALTGGLSVGASSGVGGSASAPASAAHSRNASATGGVLDESVFPTLNLSNRLNPNNTHYDHNLASRYKRMSKAEKEQLWAQDRMLQEQLRQLHKAAQATPGLSAALGGTPGTALGGAGLGGALGGTGLDLGSLLGSPLAMQLLGLGGGLGTGLSNNSLVQLAAGLGGQGLGGLAPLLAQQQQASLLGLLQQPAGSFGLLGNTSTDQMLLAAVAALQQQQQQQAATAALLGNATHGRSVSLDQLPANLQLGAGQDPVALAALLLQQQQQAPFSMQQQPPQQQQQQQMKWDDAGSGVAGGYPSVPPGLGHSPNSNTATSNAARNAISIEALASAPASAVQQLAASGGFPGGTVDAQGLFAGLGGDPNSLLGAQFAGAGGWPATSLADFSSLLQQQPQQLQTTESNTGYQ